jgi:hypothetical protein
MPGALLRTGKLQEFKALGEDGQPVYTSALQLREAIRLKLGRDAAHCLAIPQRNETGDQIDWYAPEEGDVVPWSAATDEERVEAKALLENMHAKLLGVGNKMRDEENRERQIFGRLLEKVIFFPDDSHVYLVNGKPVLTFWGFTDPKGSSTDDPLGRLRARAPVAARPEAAPPVTPEPELPPVVPVVPKKRFSWWWLLLIPLLLLLLFFLLRACAPDVPLPFITPDLKQPEAQDLQPRERMPDGGRYDVNGAVDGSATGGVGGEMTGGENMTPPAGTDEPGTENPGAEEPAADQPAEEAPPELPSEEQQPEEPQPEEQTPPEQEEPPAPEDQQNDQQQPPEQEQPQPEQQQSQPPQQQNPEQPGQPPKPMEIPPDAMQKGSTDFLNGKWKAGAGIQDARTGKPMHLDYDFKDGKGKVRVSGGNGVECVGDVNATVGGGGLTINNQGQAKCNDGSSYKLPDVRCKPGATSAADCTGTYENNKQFPMSIKKGG